MEREEKIERIHALLKQHKFPDFIDDAFTGVLEKGEYSEQFLDTFLNNIEKEIALLKLYGRN